MEIVIVIIVLIALAVILGVPKRIGNWEVTQVQVAYQYPDNSTGTRIATKSAAGVSPFTPSASVRQTPMSIWYESSPAILSASSLMACTRVSSPANQPAFSSLDVMV